MNFIKIISAGLVALSCQSGFATYVTLPTNETLQCPAHREFYLDHFCRLGEKTNGQLDCIACPNESDFAPNGLIRGGQPTRQGITFLKKIGVGLVIDLRSPSEDAGHMERDTTAALGISYLDLPLQMDSSDVVQNEKLVAQALEAIAELRHSHPNQLIYIHCQRGEDRTGLQIAAYRKLVELAGTADIEREMNEHYFNWHYPGLADAWKAIKSHQVF